jgi:hypothetical protein
MFCEFLTVMQSPVAELMRTFSIVVPLFPSITSGSEGVSGVGLDVAVAAGAGVGVGTGAMVGERVALGEALDGLALGELVVLSCGVMVGVDVVFGDCAFDVVFGDCRLGASVVGVGMAGGTVKVAESHRVRPSAYFTAAFISWSPPVNVEESRGLAEPAGKVPPKSKGACLSVTRLAVAVPGSKVNATRLITDSPARTNM